MKTIIIITALAGLVSAASAQETREETFARIGAEVEAIQRQLEFTSTSMSSGGSRTLEYRAAAAMNNAIQRASELAASLKNNPYATLTGFQISIGLPPSLDLQFTIPLDPAVASAKQP